MPFPCLTHRYGIIFPLVSSPAQWVKLQRRKYHNVELLVECKQKLDEIGFEWRLKHFLVPGDKRLKIARIPKSDEDRQKMQLETGIVAELA